MLPNPLEEKLISHILESHGGYPKPSNKGQGQPTTTHSNNQDKENVNVDFSQMRSSNQKNAYKIKRLIGMLNTIIQGKEV